MSLRQSHAAAYGAGSLELIPGADQPGCPSLYYHRYESALLDDSDLSMPLTYGRTLHKALELMEELGLSPDEALQRCWPVQLSPDRYEEALLDLEAFLSRSADNVHTIATELDLEAVLYEDEDFGTVRISGRVDRLGVDPDEPRLLIFDDYKTNRKPFSRRDLEEWIQGRWYAALIWLLREKFLGTDDEGVRIVARLDALKHNRLEKMYSYDELQVFLAWAETVARQILRDEDAEPKLNPACGRCPIRANCTAWNALPGIGLTIGERMTMATLEERVEHRMEAAKIKLSLDKQIKDVDRIARERIAENKEQPVVVGGWEAYLHPGQARAIPGDGLHDILGPEAFDYMKAAMGEIDKLIKKRPELDGPITEITSFEPTTTLKWRRAPELEIVEAPPELEEA